MDFRRYGKKLVYRRYFIYGWGVGVCNMDDNLNYRFVFRVLFLMVIIYEIMNENVK